MKPITLALLFLILLAACKKDKNQAPTPVINNYPTTAANKGKVRSAIGIPDSKWYVYDDLGRCIKVVDTLGGNEFLTYNQDTVIDFFPLDSSYLPVIKFIYTLDRGNINTWDQYTDSILLTSIKCTYDNQGYLLATTRIDFRTYQIPDTNQYYYSYSDGNVTAITGNQYLITYSYYTDKLESRNYGKPSTGKGNKNLPSSINNQGTVTNYTYEYDSRGRVSKETSIAPPVTQGQYGPRTTVYTYYD